MNPQFCATIGLMVLSAGFVEGIDGDADGMSDVWQGTYQIAGTEAWEDLDRDGYSCFEECQFRSNPRLNGSPVAGNDLFGMPWFSAAGNGIRIEWPAAAGVRYLVEVTEAFESWILSGGFVSVEAPSVAGVVSPMAPGAPRQFVRILPFPPLDLDGDRLDSWEEGALGTSDEEADSDGDGVPDGMEFIAGVDPLLSADADEDGLEDDWEIVWYGDLGASGSGDLDGDGLLDSAEYRSGITSPSISDSDGDGANDGYETTAGTAPATRDGTPGGTDATLLIVH